MSPIPDNVLDKQLYGKIKQQIHAELDAKGTRWGIYASSRLVKTYKDRGGRYSDDAQYHAKKANKQAAKMAGKLDQTATGLDRWFEQVWINICQSQPPQKLVKCGRQTTQNPSQYPVCRPFKRVSSKTPTTWEQMDRNQIERICAQKRRDPLKILPKMPTRARN